MKSDFIKTINSYKRYQDTLEKLSDLGVDMWDNGFNDPTDYIFEAYIEEILNDEGQDLVYWWMFEDVEKVIYEDEDKEKVIANVESIEDFYNYLVEGGYFTKD
jgi:hypothetical protein